MILVALQRTDYLILCRLDPFTGFIISAEILFVLIPELDSLEYFIGPDIRVGKLVSSVSTKLR